MMIVLAGLDVCAFGAQSMRAVCVCVCVWWPPCINVRPPVMCGQNVFVRECVLSVFVCMYRPRPADTAGDIYIIYGLGLQRIHTATINIT